MSIRALNKLPSEAYPEAKQVIRSVRLDAIRYRDQFTASGADSETILGVLAGLSASRAQLDILGQTPGLAQYARDQEGDQNYDAGAEFTSFMALVQTAGVAMAQAIPKSAGYLLANTLDADGFRVPRTFTPAELATVISALDDIVAFIV